MNSAVRFERRAFSRALGLHHGTVAPGLGRTINGFGHATTFPTTTLYTTVPTITPPPPTTATRTHHLGCTPTDAPAPRATVPALRAWTADNIPQLLAATYSACPTGGYSCQVAGFATPAWRGRLHSASRLWFQFSTFSSLHYPTHGFTFYRRTHLPTPPPAAPTPHPTPTAPRHHHGGCAPRRRHYPYVRAAPLPCWFRHTHHIAQPTTLFTPTRRPSTACPPALPAGRVPPLCRTLPTPHLHPAHSTCRHHHYRHHHRARYYPSRGTDMARCGLKTTLPRTSFYLDCTVTLCVFHM